MKTKFSIYSVLLAGLLLTIMLNCKKEAMKVAPTVTITEATNITTNSAMVSSSISSDGGSEVLFRGVVWSTHENPTTSDSKTSDGKGKGSYISSLTSLNPGTSYFLKSYAINGIATAYSSQISFKTLAVLATLTTTESSAISSTSIMSGGNITNNGGSEIIARGVCWNTSQNPTILDNKSSEGTGSGVFTSTITGLIPGTTYYIRSYSTNSIGTAYGNQVTTITLATLPTLSTTTLYDITSTTASSGGNITNDGGASIIARGVCWSTNRNPTIADSKSTDGSGKGTFESKITGLIPGSTYYVRAYAINSVGTAYGNSDSTTTKAILPVILTNELSTVTSNSAIGGGNITNDGGSTITARGICWSTKQTPSIADNKTSDGTGKGIFSSNLTGLTPGLTYYIRAYATNSIGIVYGNQVTVTTLATLPTISTAVIKDIAETSATSGGTISFDGGASIIEKGVYYGTNINPETTGIKLKSDLLTNLFSIPIINIKPGTTYYVKAYAINIKGTSYGDLVSFKTSNFTFALVDISKETKWNYWLIDKNKDSFFFNVTAGKPTVMLLNLHNSSTSYPIFFNDQGFPEKVIIDNQIFIFQNYSGKYVDIAAILPDGTIDVVKKVETQINWDLYKQKSGNVSVSGILNYAGRAVGFVPCGLSVAAAFGSYGVLWLLPAYTCGTYFVSLAADIQKDEFGVSNGFSDIIDNYENVDLMVNCPVNLEECFFSAASKAIDNLADATKKIENNKDQINTVQYVIANGFKVTTSLITSITDYSAVAGGFVTTDGVNRIDERGVFYGTSQTPEISGNKLIIGSGTGNFTSTIYGLNSNTSYYIKAYARSGQKTEYGALQTIKTDESQVVPPTLTTTAASSIASTSATSGGNITSDGGASVTSRGICWSTSQTPTTSSNKTSDGTGTGSFTSSITGLSASTTYYVRAYAINSAGTAYGSPISFTTTAAAIVPVAPTLATTAASSVASTTATSGGNISSDGGAAVTSRGVCWSTSQTPTTSSNKTTDGTGTGSFTSSITGLSANTTYYVRSYAINSAGTGYGSQTSFTTTAAAAVPVAPTLSTTAASSISSSSATSGGNISSDGGATVTSRGVCWSTSQTPTTSSNKTTDGTGTGSFTSSITGLSANTTYYVRSYAINSAGTGYGSQTSFTTTAAAAVPVAPTLTTSAAYSIASTTATSGGNISSDGGATVTSRGVCWSTSQTPTISGNKTSNGTGIGSFSSSITGLSANTIYYVRSYAINSAGTGYGSPISFTTTAAVPTVVPALNTYGACGVGIVPCSANITFGVEMINAKIVSINTSTHQIVFEIKKCDGSKFGTRGNWTVISYLCGGTGSITYGTGSFQSGIYSFQMTVVDNNMVSSKAYVPYIVQTTSFTYYYSAPAMVITY